MSDEEQSLRDLNAKLARNILSDPIFNVKKTVLSNGLTVLFNKDTSRDDAYMIIYVKGGAEKDPPGKGVWHTCTNIWPIGKGLAIISPREWAR